MRLFGRLRGRCWPGGAAWGRECRRRSSVLLLNLSDTAATSQDGSSLEFVTAIAGRQCFIQNASGRGLCPWGINPFDASSLDFLTLRYAFLASEELVGESVVSSLFSIQLSYGPPAAGKGEG